VGISKFEKQVNQHGKLNQFKDKLCAVKQLCFESANVPSGVKAHHPNKGFS